MERGKSYLMLICNSSSVAQGPARPQAQIQKVASPQHLSSCPSCGGGAYYDAVQMLESSQSALSVSSASLAAVPSVLWSRERAGLLGRRECAYASTRHI